MNCKVTEQYISFTCDQGESCFFHMIKHIHEQPEVKIQYFVPDGRKSGGAIVEVSGKVKKISATDGTIVMADGCIISITDVIEVSV